MKMLLSQCYLTPARSCRLHACLRWLARRFRAYATELLPVSSLPKLACRERSRHHTRTRQHVARSLRFVHLRTADPRRIGAWSVQQCRVVRPSCCEPTAPQLIHQQRRPHHSEPRPSTLPPSPCAAHAAPHHHLHAQRVGVAALCVMFGGPSLKFSLDNHLRPIRP